MMNQEQFDRDVYERVKKGVLEAVVRHFSPEFVNRIDETVVFHPLQQAQIRGIAEIQIDLLNARLAHSELALSVSDAVLDHVARVGYDPVYGARPLKRAIQNGIENPLAQHVLARCPMGQGDTIHVDIDSEGELKFTRTQATPDQAGA
jgi:ATP-dependent Clp protease ATP-binding subunit ClpB